MIPSRRIEDQVVGVTARERSARLLQQLQQIPIADEDPGQIGEAIPAKIECPDMQRDWRKAQIGELREP